MERPGISIRASNVADAEVVSALLAASYSRLRAGFYSKAELIRGLPRMTSANPKLLNSGTYYVAVSDDGAIIGCGGWTREKPGTGEIIEGVAHLRHFATHPDVVRRGIGRMLLNRCASAAQAAGAVRFQVFSSLNAESFYASVGLVRVRRIDIDLGDGVKLLSILMEGPVTLPGAT